MATAVRYEVRIDLRGKVVMDWLEPRIEEVVRAGRPMIAEPHLVASDPASAEASWLIPVDAASTAEAFRLGLEGFAEQVDGADELLAGMPDCARIEVTKWR